MSVTELAAALLEGAVNRALAADPEVREQFHEVEGARVRIDSDLFPYPLDIVLGPRLRVLDPEAADREDGGCADVTISGSVLALARLASRNATPDALPEGVTVSGDLGLARRLHRLIRRYRFDWEEALSRCLGDAAAHEAARQAGSARRWARSAAESLSRDVAEYLVEERCMVAGASMLGRFFDAVDELRDDVERLEARVAEVSRRTGGEPA